MSGRAKTEKMSVTLPKELAGENRSIAAHGEISALFTEALEYYLAHRRQKIALENGFGAWKDEDYPELATPEDTLTFINALRNADIERLKMLAPTESAASDEKSQGRRRKTRVG